MCRQWLYVFFLVSCSLATSYAGVDDRLHQAIKNPEYLLTHWINLPTAGLKNKHQHIHLSLRDAILLALRYNPNIQNAELDRIVQRYQLRLAQNEFELHYALAGSAMIQSTRYSGIGQTTTHNYVAAPVFTLKNKLGTQASLRMDNRVAIDGNYTPLADFTITQPLLRGFGFSVNQVNLLNAMDQEALNKLALKQRISDEVTQVIIAYRALILSSNSLDNTRHQLNEARDVYAINKTRIAAGELESTANIQQAYQIESLNMMLEQARDELSHYAQALLQVIGLDPNSSLALPNDVDFEQGLIPDVKQAIDAALLHNVDYARLKKALLADERAYTIAKNQQLWQLDATGNVQLGSVTGVDSVINQMNSIYNGKNTNQSVGVRLTIPLHDINQRNQLIRAKVQLEQDRINLAAAKRELMTRIKNIIYSIQSQAKRHDLAKRQISLAAKVYELEKKRQQAGISSALDVNNTQNQFISAQRSLIASKIVYLNQLTLLQQLIGTTLEQWDIHLRFNG